jgi:uncharacterized protein
MDIVVFGTGFVGRTLADELTGRGHVVTAVNRHPDPSDPAAWASVTGSVHDPDLVARLAAGADAVVSALPPLDDDGGLPASTAALLATAAGTRLGIVGSSAILPGAAQASELPDWLTARVEAHRRTMERLRAAPPEVDWLYLAPAAEFGPHAPGTPTGRYRTSTTGPVVDADGRSRIGVRDYALAYAHELERPTVHRGFLAVGY